MNASSNQTLMEDTSCPLVNASKFIYYYLLPVISAIGILSNLFSTIVFYQIIKMVKVNGRMYNYLFLKSINDLLQFIFQIFSPVYYCVQCETSRSYGSIVWYIGFFYYAECVVEIISGWLEVLATLDCLVIITKRAKFINSKLFAICAISFLHIYAPIFYLFWFFSLDIVVDTSVTTSVSYTSQMNPFFYTDFARYMRYLHSIVRDFVVFITLVILNFFILIFLKKNTLRKKDLLKSDKHTASAEKAEKNNELMIMLIGINYLIGHFGSILYYVPFPASPQFWNCFYDFNLIPFYISYIDNNLMYYFFNKNFRKYANQNLKSILNVFVKEKS